MKRVVLLTLLALTVVNWTPALAVRQDGRSASSAPEAVVTEAQRLQRETPMIWDGFGTAVAIDGEWLAVGVPWGTGTVDNQGLVDMYRWNGTAWALHSTLVASDPLQWAAFGQAVALQGSRLVVGAPEWYSSSPFNTEGAVYIYSWNGTAWVQDAKLVDPDQDVFFFGGALALDGSTLVVGAVDTENEEDYGAVVYVLAGGTWTRQYRFWLDDDGTDPRLGASVGLSGDTAVICSISSSNASVFARSGTTWTRQALVAGDDDRNFCNAVSLSGDSLIAGASEEWRDGQATPGAAYIFTRHGTTWTREAKLEPLDGVADDEFGSAVALKGGVAVVGAFRRASGGEPAAGAAYLFRRTKTGWTQVSVFEADSPVVSSELGFAVATDGLRALVGAHEETIDELWSAGAAYVFQPVGDLDLQAMPLVSPPKAGPGEQIVLTDRVKNLGPDPAPASQSYFYLSPDSVLSDATADQLLGVRSLAAIPAKGTNKGSTTLTIPADTQPGLYYLLAVADGAGVLPERSETNNLKFKSVVVGCDLFVATIIAPSKTAVGSSIDVTDATKNKGPGAVPPSQTRMVISGNQTYGDDDDRELYVREVPALKAGAQSKVTTHLTLPAELAAGQYYLIAASDVGGTAPENNEGNNRRIKPIQLQ